MELTVIIATFRRQEVLRRTLEAYRRMDSPGVPWRLVLVDNADDRDTQELARVFAKDFPLDLLVEPRRGKNFAMNMGLERAEGDLLVFSDDDSMPEADWLAQIWAGARRWPDVTMFTGRILAAWPEGHAPVDTRTDLLRSSYGITSWGEEEGDISPFKVWGPSMAVRRGPFDDGHRFDTDIGPSAGQYAMGSELELAIRLSRAGHKAVYLPRAIVHHQIRPEQMSESWLKWRAYRSGRGVARLQGVPKTRALRGVPLFIFREIATHGLEWFQGWLRRNGEERLDGKLETFHWLGKLREYWSMGRRGG